MTPGAGLDRVDRVVDGVLHVRVAARPVDGAANESLLRLIAAELGIARSRVTLRTGASARRKLIEVEGLDATAVRSRWPGIGV